MKQTPQISIILATWNRAHLIGETLQNISKQSFGNWECLIIDDGSEDDTASVVETFISSDTRFTFVHRNENHKKGLPGCRNQGLDLARGEFLIFFDDDDIVHPENLQTCFNLLIGSKLSFCRYNKKPFWNDSKNLEFKKIGIPVIKPFKLDDIDKMITGEIAFASCCVMWNKQCFEEVRFNEYLMYAEEWECYSRILAKGFTGVSINEILYFNRKHPDSNTGEFFRKDPVRMKSKICAAQLILENVGRRKLMNKNLEKFFVRLGFELNSLKVIKLALENYNSGFYKRSKYIVGFYLYPFLWPLFKLKRRLKLH